MTNRDDKKSGILGRVLTAAPMIIGTGIGINSLISNRGSALSALKTGNLSSIGNNVGNNIHNLERTRNINTEATAKALRDSLLGNSRLKEILAKDSDEKKALISAILNIIDSPNSGLEIESKTASIRENLISLMDKESQGTLDEQEKMLGNIIDTVFSTGSENTKKRLSDNIKDFRNYKTVLASPLPIDIKGLNAGYTEISVSDLSPMQQSHVKNIQEIISSSPDSVVKLYKGKLAGQEVVEARVYKSSSQRSLKGSNYFQINLSMATDTVSGSNLVRIGQGSTTYAPAALYTNVSNINRTLLDNKKKISSAEKFNNLINMNEAYDFVHFSIYKLKELVDKKGFSALKPKDYHASLTEVAEQVPRAGRFNSKVNPAYAAYYSRGVGINSRTMVIGGIEGESQQVQKTLRAKLASSFSEELDSSGDPLISRTDNGSYMRISLRSGSTLSQLPQYGNYPTDRALHPVTAREKQFIGRTTMFADDTYKSRINSGNVLANQPGYTHRAMILDVTDNALLKLGLGEGEAYVGGLDKSLVELEVTKTVPNPTEYKLQSTELLNELLYLRQSGEILTVGEGNSHTIRTGRHKGKAINNVDDFFKFFSSSVDSVAVLGFGENNQPIGLPKYQGLRSIKFGIEESTDSNNKSLYHAAATISLYSPNTKLFGPLFKGTSRNLNEFAWKRIREQRIGKKSQGELLDSMGVNRENLVVAEGSMIKKSPLYLAEQVFGGFELITKRDPIMISRFMEGIRGAKDIELARQGGAEAYRKTFVEDLTRGTARALTGMKETYSNEQVGMLFAGLRTFYKDEEEFKETLRKEFGNKYSADDITSIANEGKAISLSGLAPGPQSAISRRNMSSIEPRTYNFLASRMKASGRSDDEITSALTSLLARKSGLGVEMSRLDSFTRMIESLGHGSRVTDLDSLRAPIVPLEDFLSYSADEASMKQFLSQKQFNSTQGFELGLDEEMKRVLKKDSIFISAGEKLIDNLGDTEIKGVETTTLIESDFVRRVHHFAEDIITLRRAQDSSSIAKAEQQVRTFKDDIGDIWASSFKGLLKGRIRGSAQVAGASVSIGSGTKSSNYASELAKNKESSFEYSDKEMDLIKKVGNSRSALSRTGSYGFADTESFLSAMRTFVSGEKDSLMSGGMSSKAAGTIAENDAIAMTQRFFLGMESNRVDGITSLVIRNPQLAATHITPMEIFRNASEVGERDVVFKQFTETESGKKALEQLQKATKTEIGGFSDIASITGNKKAKHEFFKSFFREMESFSSGEGLGRLQFVNMETDVTYTNKTKRRIDLSTAAGMIGDFDGDTYQMILPGKGSRKLFNEISDEGVNAEVMRRFTTRIFTEETKEGIRNFTSGLSTEKLSVDEDIFESALKERIGKDVGNLDVALDRLRLGVVSNTSRNAVQETAAQQTLSVLTALEEISLKAKKAPRGIEINDALSNVINNFIEKGDSQGFESFIRNTLFKGTALEQGSITVEGLDLSAVPKQTREAFGRLVGTQISLEPIFEILREAAISSKDIGADMVKTIRQLSAGATRAEYYDSYQAAVVEGNSPQAAMLNGFRAKSDDTGIESASQMIRMALGRASASKRSLNSFASKMIKPVGIGAIASFGIGMISNDSGYAPTPLVQPGDFTDAVVNSSIMAGTATDHQIDPNSLPQSSNTSLIDRPINIGNATMTQRNAFQMSGQITSYAGVQDTISLVNRLGASSHVTINDNRRPMSRHFLDRIFGD